jgi:large subunit ribosomal protein L13
VVSDRCRGYGAWPSRREGCEYHSRSHESHLHSFSVDTGDYVVIVNAEKVVLTGKKEEQNTYMFFSGFVGGESYRSLQLQRERHPEFIIEHAVKGMLPKNRIAAKMLTKLRVFAGNKHTHEAQNPIKISV